MVSFCNLQKNLKTKKIAHFLNNEATYLFGNLLLENIKLILEKQKIIAKLIDYIDKSSLLSELITFDTDDFPETKDMTDVLENSASHIYYKQMIHRMKTIFMD